jgi:hypothetical protein
MRGALPPYSLCAFVAELLILYFLHCLQLTAYEICYINVEKRNAIDDDDDKTNAVFNSVMMLQSESVLLQPLRSQWVLQLWHYTHTEHKYTDNNVNHL